MITISLTIDMKHNLFTHLNVKPCLLSYEILAIKEHERCKIIKHTMKQNMKESKLGLDKRCSTLTIAEMTLTHSH